MRKKSISPAANDECCYTIDGVSFDIRENYPIKVWRIIMLIFVVVVISL